MASDRPSPLLTPLVLRPNTQQIYIHGGLWTDRDKQEYAHLGRFFARHGFAVAVINYRLTTSDPEQSQLVQHPEHCIDVARAIEFLLDDDRSSYYGYSTERLTLIGHSCGAHMASLLTLEPESYFSSSLQVRRFQDSLNRVIGIQGIYSLRQFGEEFPDWVQPVNRAFGTDRAKWDSPTDVHPVRVAQLPHFFLIHAPTDQWVKTEQCTRFAERLRELPHRCHVEVTTQVSGSHNGIIEAIDSKHRCPKDEEDISTLLLDAVTRSPIV